MRKPQALTASLVRSNRVWHAGQLLTTPPAAPQPSDSIASSSPFVHVVGAADKDADLAPRVYSLLQLELRTVLLRTFADNTTSSRDERSKSTTLFGDSQSTSTTLAGLQQRLTGEEQQLLAHLLHLRLGVYRLGNLLLAHYRSQCRKPATQMCEKGELTSEREHRHTHRNDSSVPQGKNSGRKSPVQVIPLPSDGEQNLLQPIRASVIQEVIQELSATQRLHWQAVNDVKLKSVQSMGTNAGVTSQSSLTSSSARSNNETNRGVSSFANAVDTEARLFYGECVRVAAALAALCGSNEGDSLGLACLTQVWRASVEGGVPVSAAALIDAVRCVQQSGGHAVPNLFNDDADCNSSSEKKGPSVPSASPSSWCSCVPWLLHRYAVTHCIDVRPFDVQVDWPLASVWVAAAADRVCATQTEELLYFSHKQSRVTSLDIEAMFGPWQPVLNLEGKDAVASLRGSRAEIGLSTRSAFAKPTPETELSEWIEPDAPKQHGRGRKSERISGTLQPYWAAVVREMRNGGAQAIAALLDTLAASTATVKHHSYHRQKKASHGNISSSSSPTSLKQQQRERDHSHAPQRSIAHELKEVQFYAMGTYVALRRITSSLQRHRRLVPLLQLHALVSGYQPCEAADGAAQDNKNSPRDVQTESIETACSTSKTVASLGSRSTKIVVQDYVKAQQQRRRLLTGELMRVRVKDTRVARQRDSRNKNSNRATSPDTAAHYQQVRQAGAMLWREVALLDAYTLITLGHVSEHAVDVEQLEKSAVLAQLSWLQHECVVHLQTLQSEPEKAEQHPTRDDKCRVAKENAGEWEEYAARLSFTQRRVLRDSLTPRTRAALIAKLQEGLRLSVKVLTRWGETEHICRLYQAHPQMGPSWEVGRALLQCGHYEAAVAVLQSLLQTANTAGEHTTAPSAVAVASSSSPPPITATLLATSAVAMRQLLLEAVQGAAAALVAQRSNQSNAGSESYRPINRTSTLGRSAERSQTLTEPSAKGPAPAEDDGAGRAEIADETTELEAPLPAQLRAQLHSLYTHAASLPVPLPLCLHAVMQGLAEACTFAAAEAAPGGNAGMWRSSEVDYAGGPLSLLNSPASPDEQLRRVAVLCTYVLRCHLAEHPSRGLLSKTVELWALSVSRYLCRGGNGLQKAAESGGDHGVVKLSVTDRYLREVTVRLLYGYPHVAAGRLLLTRLLQQWSMVTSTTKGLASSVNSFNPAHEPGARGHGEVQARLRTEANLDWLLRQLFRFAGGACLKRGLEPHQRQLQHQQRQESAYPICTPSAAAAVEDGAPWWNVDFTERYTQDTLRLMPRVALDSLLTYLSTQRCGELQYIVDRVEVALCSRADEDDAQHQPWQCTTCHLWNGRYTSECKRCHTLATSLLQCRTCRYFTSSAGYRAARGLGCEVCGTLLVGPAEAALHQESNEAALLTAHPTPNLSDASPAQVHPLVTASPLSSLPASKMSAAAAAPSTAAPVSVGAATVTGSGRPSSLFRDGPGVLRVVALRPWTCTHCRTSNDAQHVFFCRSCGRPPEGGATTLADAGGDEAEVEPCGCCGHQPKSVEARLLPWCERCGALRERLRRLLAPSALPTAPPLSSSSSLSPQMMDSAAAVLECRPLRSPTLWWCAECVVTLNPWTRTYCSLCGAGRPAAASTTSSSSEPDAQTHLSDSNSVCNTQASRWLGNAAAPFVTVPWSMQPCAQCQAPCRVGSHLCWKCGAAQTWPSSVKQAVASAWQLWLTQVTHVATVETAATASLPESDAGESTIARQEKRENSLSRTVASAARLSAPLLLPRNEQWVCLRDGCLHVNGSSSTSQVTVSADSAMRRTPVSCAACHAPRRHEEVFNPFRDRLTWRKPEVQASDNTGIPCRPSPVEALILPRRPPSPGERMLVTRPTSPSTATVCSVASSVLGASEVPQALTARSAKEVGEPCACCGANATTRTETRKPSLHSLSAQSVNVPIIFLVKVCRQCGQCSWGRSCGAYDVSVQPLGRLALSCGALLPGEEALALRLLLRSLAQTVQQAVRSESGAHQNLTTPEMGLHAKGGAPDAAATVCPTKDDQQNSLQKLDWAWFSRHVFSAVRLIHDGSPHYDQHRTSQSVTITLSAMDGHSERSARDVREARRIELRDALLPWRGCDVATALQRCSAAPRVATLSDAADTVHSALHDVQTILEGICEVVEARVAQAPPPSRHLRQSKVNSARSRKDVSAGLSAGDAPLPPCLQDAWTRRLMCAALDLVDVVNRSTVCDEIGFATLRRLCRLLRPDEAAHIDTETKWCYLQEMKLPRAAVLHGCVRCERCLTNHAPGQPCAAL